MRYLMATYLFAVKMRLCGKLLINKLMCHFKAHEMLTGSAISAANPALSDYSQDMRAMNEHDEAGLVTLAG